MSTIPEPRMPAPRAPRQRNAFAQAASPPVQPSPPRSPENEPAQDAADRHRSVQPSTGAESNAGVKERSKRMEGTRDILLSMPSSQKERMEATIAHTQAFTGVKHQQVFIRTAVERLCEQLEQQYNQGHRYPLPPSAPSL